MDRYGGRDRYDDRGSRDYDRGYDSRIGSGRRAFGSGYRRDDDYRGEDLYEDRCNRREDWSWNSRDDYSRDDFRREDRGPLQRPKLNLKPRSAPKDEDSSGSTSQSSRAASVFGGAKPVGTAANEREVEDRPQKKQEKLQRQREEPKLESEETQELSRTASESSQTGNTAPYGRNKRKRESEKSLENETFNKEENSQSPTSKPSKSDQPPLKVMPSPPPKENAWVKRSSKPPARSQSSDSSEQQSPTNGVGKVISQQSEEGPANISRKADENKVDGVSVLKGQSGNFNSGPVDGGSKDHWKESDRKDGRRDQDSRPASEPRKPEENLSKLNLYPDKTK
uniref:Eukaryotic translation initiation factor 4B n=1 Tax=Vombatus ursinus TaxID=29139 RepID=A0A4X2JYC6_VOMUR